MSEPGEWEYDFDPDEYRAAMEEGRRETIENFKSELLQSFYLDHPNIVERPTNLVSEAGRLLPQHPGASIVLAVAAIEITIREVLLRPVISGLIHQPELAEAVTELTLDHRSLDNCQDLFFKILERHGRIDMKTITRKDSTVPLWKEIQEVITARNRVVHQGTSMTADRATHAVSVASTLVGEIVPAILFNLGLHTHRRIVCGGIPCFSAADKP